MRCCPRPRPALPLHGSRRLALGLIVLAAAGCTDTAGPVAEPEERLIFLSTRDGATDGLGRPMREIYRMFADGTGAENLTRQPAWQYNHLSLSPDGSRIAFSSDRPGCDILVMQVDGTGLSQLTNRNGGNADGCNGWPRWSPDGTRIAFATNRENRSAGATQGLYDVYVMDANGGNPRNVSRALGDQMGFAVAVSGWSPDGRVVFQTSDVVAGAVERRVYIVNADGTGLLPLFRLPGEHSPAWSPDGSRLVFISERDGRRSLYIMNADGSGERPLTAHAGDDWLPGAGGGAGAEADYSPWSPDGTRIAFQRDLDLGWGIHVINADGTGLRRLTDRPATFNGWSPRGDRIAFTEVVSRPGIVASDVFIINADGTGRVNLTNSPADDSDALWLPRR